VRTILDKRSNVAGTGGYALYISFGHLGCQMADPGGFTNFTETSTYLADGTWHHVAMTLNRATGLKREGGSLWIDGVEVLPLDPLVRPGSVSNAGELRIGQAYDNSSLAFDGDIDEVELFNRCLGLDEVNSICLASSAGKCKDIGPPTLPGLGRFGALLLTALLLATGVLAMRKRRIPVGS